MENARKYALDILERVFVSDGYAALLMRKESGLGDRDRAFVSEVVYGTVRSYALLEFQWRHLARRKVRKRTALLLDMTLYQIFFLDRVPDYAAVSGAVDLAPRHEKGFVNAVLRGCVRQGFLEPEDPAVRYSHPQWILSLWKAHYGEKTAYRIAAADQQPSVMYGRINTLKTSRRELETRFHFVNEYCFTADEPLQGTPEFADGRVLIQDIHSAAVPLLLNAAPGMYVLDACAAPGTKTQETAMLMENRGRIIACDLYEARTGLIRRLMADTGVSIAETRTCDASVPGQFPERSFDRILLDVPCSGLGDLAHKPEIRWHLTPENLDALAETQKRILEANAPYLKPGGILVYSTCTLNRKENEQQIAFFCRNHPEFQLLSERTWFPFEEGGDGFYAAQLLKRDQKFMV